MKNGMKKKCELGKKSNYLTSLKPKSRHHSEMRQSLRHLGKTKVSSTKISKSSMNNSIVYRTNKYLNNTNRKGQIVDNPINENLKAAR